jgi:alpha-glucosidase (family GH31 glycosyl hydrolase)
MTLKNGKLHSTCRAHQEIEKAFLLFESLDERVLRLKITDEENERWEVPIYNPDSRKYYTQHQITDMGLSYNSPPFGFHIADPRTQELFVSMNSKNTSLYFSDKLIEYALWFPADDIFGLGERVNPSFELCDGDYRECVYTSYNKDVETPLDEGNKSGGKNGYGHQPFYMVKLKNGLFAGVLFLNSNAQDTVISRKRTGITVTHKTIGGIIDSYFFYPAKAEDVIKNYHSFIGRPYLPPIWTLGFHQCRWGWKTVDKVKEVVTSFELADIPLDVVWADIDYMQDFRDFSVDNSSFKGLGTFVDELHKKGMYWVPIIDAGLKYDVNDIYYQEGEKMNAFIRSARTKKTLIGKVWPGYAVYPAWMNPNASSIWQMGLSDLYAQVKFDGLWIDMNEASNFCDGECDTEETRDIIVADETDSHNPNEFDDLPYLPGNSSLLIKAVAPSGYHVVNDEYGDKFYKEYNLHSLWAFHQANSTNKFFAEVQKRRPFILTRANFPGIGRFTSKWLGDNHSTWEDMRYSIIGMYNYQLFGVPLVGADMCGFISDTTEELCARWMQLGAFYPFSRNHNTEYAMDQEPYLWNSVATASRNAIRQKYSILRYYYTKLFEISLHGGALVKPLFFDHPGDEEVYKYRNKAFLIGSSVMVVPVLEPNVTTVTTYLPNQNWFDLFSGEQLLRYNPKKIRGKEVKFAAGLDHINVLAKGGNVVPFQEALKEKVTKQGKLNNMPLNMIVVPDGEGNATGNVIFDKEDAINPIATNEYTEITMNFSMKDKSMKVNTKGRYKLKKDVEKFNTLTILGAESMSKATYAHIKDKFGQDTVVSGIYDSDKKTMQYYAPTNIYWGDIEIITFSTN